MAGSPGMNPEQLLASNRWLQNLARSLVADAGVAEDLVQQTWTTYLAKPPRQPGSSTPWLARVLRRLAAMHHREEQTRRQREQAAAQSEGTKKGPAEALEKAELRRTVVNAVLDLREPYRSTLVLRFFEELTPNEIARQQDTSLHTVNTRIRRGLEQVREVLDRRYRNRSAWMAVALPIAEGLPPLAAGAAVVGTGGVASFVGATWMSQKTVTAAAIAVVLTAGLLYVTVDPLTESGAAGSTASPSAPDPMRTAVAGAGSGGASTRAARTEESAAGAEFRIAGVVVDTQQRGVPKARVLAIDDSGQSVGGSTCDETGAFQLELVDSQVVTVHAFRSQVGLGTAAGVVPGVDALGLTLEPLSAVSGRLLVKDSNQAIPLASVRFDPRGFENDDRVRVLKALGLEVSRTVQADDEGRYEIPDLPAGRYLLRFPELDDGFVAPGTFGLPTVEISLESGESREGFDVALSPASSIAGQVMGADGRPCAEARVELLSSAHSYLGHFSAGTDAAGRFQFGGLSVGSRYVVLAHDPRWSAGRSEVVSLPTRAPVEDLTITLGRGHTARGRVVDESGLAIPGVHLPLRWSCWNTSSGLGLPATTSDSSGQFQFENLLAGDYSIVASVDGFDNSRVHAFQMPADQDLGDLVITLQRDAHGFVEGRVTDSEGTPLVGIRVLASGFGDGFVQEEVWTDESGLYRMDGLGRANSLDVSVYATGYADEHRKGIALNSRGVDFQLAGLGRVRGRVLCARSGDPVPQFQLRSVSYRSRPQRIPDTWVDVSSDDGSFQLDEVEPPRVHLDVLAPGYAFHSTDPFEVTAATTRDGVDIYMEPAAILKAIVTAAEAGEPLQGVHVRVYDQGYFHPMFLNPRPGMAGGRLEFLDMSNQDGRVSFDSLPSGAVVHVVAWHPGRGTLVRSDLSVDDTTTLDLEMPAAGRLVVTLSSVPDGSPRILLTATQLGTEPARLAFRQYVWSEDGRFELKDLPAGRFSVRIEDKQRQELAAREFEITAGETTEGSVDL